MERKEKSLLWVSLLLALGAACAAGQGIYVNYTGLSFGGFGALLALLLLVPGFCALALDVLLLAIALKGRPGWAKGAYWLQILSGLPFAWLLYRQPMLFSLFGAHGALIILGIIGLISLKQQGR